MNKKGLLAVICMGLFFSSCSANPKKLCEIIFWDNDDNLSINILNSESLENLLNTYSIHTILDFRLFSEYDREENSLYFYPYTKKINISKDEIVLNTEYNVAKSYMSIFDKISYGNNYFSIIVDGRIILNGLNRIGHYSPIPEEFDDIDIPKIILENNVRLRICYQYWTLFEQYTPMQKEKEKKLYVKEIEEVFRKKSIE